MGSLRIYRHTRTIETKTGVEVDIPISETRTRWAEEQVEQLLSIPFISEFVFRSPQNLEGPRNTQREVADLLIDHLGKGLLVSQKTQEDPESRDERRNQRSINPFDIYIAIRLIPECLDPSFGVLKRPDHYWILCKDSFY
jgi:hypothetical protein